MDRKYVYLLSLTVLIVASNFLPAWNIGEPFRYRTQDGEFMFRSVPTKGTGIDVMEERFLEFIEKHPIHKKLILYRTFKKEFYKFWKWREYLTYKRWKYPYLYANEFKERIIPSEN